MSFCNGSLIHRCSSLASYYGSSSNRPRTQAFLDPVSISVISAFADRTCSTPVFLPSDRLPSLFVHAFLIFMLHSLFFPFRFFLFIFHSITSFASFASSEIETSSGCDRLLRVSRLVSLMFLSFHTFELTRNVATFFISLENLRRMLECFVERKILPVPRYYCSTFHVYRTGTVSGGRFPFNSIVALPATEELHDGRI